MNKTEDIERINTKIAASFGKIETGLSDATDIAGLFEILFTGIEKEFEIPLDYIYTSKLMFAVFDLMSKNKIKAGAKILIIHSGGLQGNKGFEQRYKL